MNLLTKKDLYTARPIACDVDDDWSRLENRNIDGSASRRKRVRAVSIRMRDETQALVASDVNDDFPIQTYLSILRVLFNCC